MHAVFLVGWAVGGVVWHLGLVRGIVGGALATGEEPLWKLVVSL